MEIKFVIVPEGFSHSRRFARGLTLAEMKSQVEEDLRIPVASMKLIFAGQGGCPLGTRKKSGCRHCLEFSRIRVLACCSQRW